MKPASDPIDHVPDPDTVRRLLADAVRRADLLRSMLRLARRKAAYDQPPHASAQGGARSAEPKGVQA